VGVAAERDHREGRAGMSDFPLPPPFDTHCLIIGNDGKIARRLSRTELERILPGRGMSGSALDGAGCYALYSPPLGRVKVGRSQVMLHRWRNLNSTAGLSLTPLVFWSCRFSSELDAHQHSKFARHREFGEWFNAAAIILELTKVWQDFRAPEPEPESEPESPPLLTGDQLAQRWEITEPDLDKMSAQRGFPNSHRFGGKSLYRLVEVKDYEFQVSGDRSSAKRKPDPQ
jgi:hypothetical protein